MSKPIALQLYSLRAQLAEDYEGGIRQVADMGYAGVEPAGFPGTTPAAAGKLFRELGLQVPSCHTAPPIGEKKQEVLDAMAAIGATRLVTGKGPADWDSVDKIKTTCDFLNEAAAAAAANGFTFHMHNHWWEFVPVEGKLAYEWALDCLQPNVCFQVDTYWVQTAGADPAEILTVLGDRVELAHIKDGPCKQGEPMTAVGQGKVNWHSVAKAAETHVKWFIVELDSCATDMVTAVRESYDYLVGEGLAHGR